MSDVDLRQHLIAVHPGAQAPWWVASGYLEVASADVVERLHDELHRQGESHDARVSATEFIKVRDAVCRRTGCATSAARSDGLCDRHGDQQDRLRGRRSA